VSAGYGRRCECLVLLTCVPTSVKKRFGKGEGAEELGVGQDVDVWWEEEEEEEKEVVKTKPVRVPGLAYLLRRRAG
jgi:hypothetical protein